jgi:hypothetical protein
LRDLSKQWLRTYKFRQIKAEEENDATPAPPPPTIENKAEASAEAVDASLPRVDKYHRWAPPQPWKIENGSALHTAEKIIEQHPLGMPAAKFAEEYQRRESENPDAFDRPHYKALEKLKQLKRVLTYKRLLFTNENLRKFIEEVGYGNVRIEEPKKLVPSKWAKAILEFMTPKDGWVDYSDIVEHISRQPMFADIANVSNQTSTNLRNMCEKHELIERHPTEKGRYRVRSDRTEEIVRTMRAADAGASATAATH